MSDERLRDLERRWHESDGDPELARALLLELIRAGRVEVPDRNPCPGCGERLVLADLEPFGEPPPFGPSTELGDDAQAAGAALATAVGARAVVSGSGGTATGGLAVANYRGTAIGYAAYADRDGVALGQNANAPPGRVAIARLGVVEACAFCGLLRVPEALTRAVGFALRPPPHAGRHEDGHGDAPGQAPEVDRGVNLLCRCGHFRSGHFPGDPYTGLGEPGVCRVPFCEGCEGFDPVDSRRELAVEMARRLLWTQREHERDSVTRACEDAGGGCDRCLRMRRQARTVLRALRVDFGETYVPFLGEHRPWLGWLLGWTAAVDVPLERFGELAEALVAGIESCQPGGDRRWGPLRELRWTPPEE